MAREEWMTALERAYQGAPWEDWVCCDPVWYVRACSDPQDQEIVGMVASALAYGRVGCIMPSVERVLAAMEGQPRAFVSGFDPARDAHCFQGFTHRFHTPAAIVAMLSAMRDALDGFGSLGALFSHGHDPAAPDTRAGLARFVGTLRGFTEARDGRGWESSRDLYGWRHYLASPEDGSACKRLNLYLRWMVRSGMPDVGAWRGFSPTPRQLLVPVDVHVSHIARRMGWTRRAAADIRMAEEVTAVLRRADDEDPTRFDFVLSHLGMDSMVDTLERPASNGAEHSGSGTGRSGSGKRT